jgi:hypothetical protein
MSMPMPMPMLRIRFHLLRIGTRYLRFSLRRLKQVNEQQLGMGRRGLQLFEIGSKLNINILTHKRSSFKHCHTSEGLLNTVSHKRRSFKEQFYSQKKVSLVSYSISQGQDLVRDVCNLFFSQSKDARQFYEQRTEGGRFASSKMNTLMRLSLTKSIILREGRWEEEAAT